MAESSCLDHTVCQQMASLMELLTTTGKPTLLEDLMKKFKRICRTSDLYVEHAFHLLLTQLEIEHAEVRLSTFQMIDELFTRSHRFRELLVSEFQKFLNLTVGTDQDMPLPPPKAAAQTLKTEAYKTIQSWYDKYGDAYKRLSLGYHFLKGCKKVDFDGIQARTLAERQRQEENERKKQNAMKNRLDKTLEEYQDSIADIEACLTEINNCIELLLPHPDDFFIPGSDVNIETEPPSRTVNASESKSEKQTTETVSQSADTKLVETAAVYQSEAGESEASSSGRGGHSVGDRKQCSCASQTEPSQTSPAGVCGDCGGYHGDGVGNQCQTGKEIKENSADHHGDGQESDTNADKKDTATDDSDGDSDDSEDVDSDESEGDFEDVLADEERVLQAYGLGSRKYCITVEVGGNKASVTETDDNKDIIQGMRDQYRLVKSKFLPKLRRWTQVMSQCGASQDQVKQAVLLKEKLEDVKRKCIELEVVHNDNDDGRRDSDSDEEFEEVPKKEGYEEDVPEHVLLEAASSSTQAARGKKRGRKLAGKQPPIKEKITPSHWSLTGRIKEEDETDPTSYKANISRLHKSSKSTASSTVTSTMLEASGSQSDGRSDSGPATSSVTPRPGTGSTKEKLLQEAPVVPFGVDLEHWENPDKIEAPPIVKNDSLHRFWTGSQDGGDLPGTAEDLAALTRRTFTYTGNFEPVKWQCRAPLPSGKLCPRMDREKCPFHGKIIARDAVGQPADPKDVERLVKQEQQKQEEAVPDWQDPELQEDIEAATGLDLGSSRSKSKGKGKGKGKGKRKKKGEKQYPNLTDIKESNNTSRNRLESKIFKPSAVKRVTAALDAIAYKRVRDKFGNQFNYSLK